MIVGKLDVVIAHAVEELSRRLVAEESRVALYEGMQTLLGEEVGGDRLNLGGRTAVQGGNRHGIDDVLLNCLDICCSQPLEAVEIAEQPASALSEDSGVPGVHHGIEEGIDLFALDALEVIAHRDIELEGVRIAECPFAGDRLDGKPCLDIFLEGLRNLQLRGPFAVIAFVLCGDAGLRHAGGELASVHLLYGLQLEEAGAAVVGGDNILRELGVRTCGGTDFCLQLSAEEGVRLAARAVALLHSEDGAALMLQQDAVHQFPKRDRGHNITHSSFSLFK